jgi:hypothetical protein
MQKHVARTFITFAKPCQLLAAIATTYAKDFTATPKRQRPLARKSRPALPRNREKNIRHLLSVALPQSPILLLGHFMKIKARDFARPERVCYLSVTVMTERIAALAAAALLVGLCMPAISADDRSFPAEVTGTIRSFDQETQTFTIKVDEPVSILTLMVGRDCKFTTNGAPGGERILKPGARVKVSYFATIFTGNIAVAIAMTTPRYAHEP